VAQPATRELIIRDQSMLSALVKFLRSEDNNVRFGALEILLPLSETTKDLKTILVKESGLLNTVKRLMMVGVGTAESQTMATRIFGNLHEVLRPTTLVEQTNGNSSTRTMNKGVARTYTIFIKGLNNEKSKAQVETALLGVKGVVSFLVDLFQQRAIIRSITSAEEIIASIEQTTSLSAVLGDNDESDENSAKSPSYLDDKAQSSWGWGIISFGSTPKKGKKPNPQDASWGGWVSKIWG
jgi:hypothetical protein